MVRPLTILSLIFTFVVALQNYTEYWVVTNDACPPEIRRLVQSCEAISTPCSGLPAEPQCEANVPVCRSAVRAECEVGQPENEYATACSSATDDCASATSDPICLQLPCATSPVKSQCCLLVHPFWGELPVKLLLPPDNLSVPAPEHQLVETADGNTLITDKYIIPPWGVHPTISTTVLRI